MKRLISMFVVTLMAVWLLPAVSVKAVSSASDFTFNASTGTITGYVGNGGNVSIPSTIDGVAVKAIGNYAFFDNTEKRNLVTAVEIPDGVETIGTGCFRSCENLADIVIPDSVKTIGGSAFESCKSLRKIRIPQGVTSIDNVTFYDCSNLKQVVIYKNLRYIGYNAFKAYTSRHMTVYYEGSEAEWNQVTIESQNNDLVYATMVYNTAYFNPRLVTNVSLDITSKALFVDEEFQLTAAVAPSDATDTNVIYSSDNPDVASVNASGYVTGRKEGTAVISATAVDGSGKSASCRVTVSVDPESLPMVYVNIKAADGTVQKKIQIFYNNKYVETVPGISYDNTTYTLTLNNYNNKNAEIVTDLKGYTVDIVVNGENHVRELTEKSGGMEIKGSGKLFVNEDKKVNGPVYAFNGIDFMDTVTVEIFSSSDTLCYTGRTRWDPSLIWGINIFGNCNNKNITYTEMKVTTTFYTYYYWTYYLKGDHVSITPKVTPNQTPTDQETPGQSNPGSPGGGAPVGTKVTVGTSKVKVTGSSAVTYIGPKSKTATSVTIPATVKIKGKTYKVTAINAKAFKGNKKITKVTIGKYVKTIGTDAFYGCTKLKKITIPNSITSIGKNAFRGCTVMTSMTIGTGLQKIGVNAFYGTKKLKTITISSTKLKSVGKNCLKGIYANARIKVPSKKVKAYTKLFKGKGQGKKVKVVKK